MRPISSKTNLLNLTSNEWKRLLVIPFDTFLNKKSCKKYTDIAKLL